MSALAARIVVINRATMCAMARAVTVLTAWCVFELARNGRLTEALQSGHDHDVRSWIVSPAGRDWAGCGAPGDLPCKNMPYVLGRVAEGDTIYLTQTADGAQPYIGCDGGTFSLPGSLRIIGQGHDALPALMGCLDVSRNESVVAFINAERRNPLLQLSNIRIVNARIAVTGFSVTIDNVSLANTSLQLTSGDQFYLGATLTGVRSSGRAKCAADENCAPSSDVIVRGNFSHVSITSSFFRQTKVTVQTSCPANVDVENNTFSNNLHGDRAVLGGLLVWLWDWATEGHVLIADCLFENQFNWSPVDTVMNIFESALLVRYRLSGKPPIPPPYNFTEVEDRQVEPTGVTHVYPPPDTTQVSLLVTNGVFINNERALTLQGDFDVTVESSVFRSNVAMHAGAGILHLNWNQTRVINTTFEHNAAGSMRHSFVNAHERFLTIAGEEVRVKSKCCKGAISLIGKGGAIRVQNGGMTLDNCHFRNNSAHISGGTVFVDRESSLVIVDSDFSNGVDPGLLAKQGDIIYSSGRVLVQGATFRVKSADNHISLFQHGGERWSVSVYDVTIECPVGHRLRVTNTTSYKVVSYTGLQRSYMLDQLSYFCESCPRYKYSRDRGYLFYHLDSGASFYFALMINGDDPGSNLMEQYDYHDIVCKKCPYGATCEDSIQALPNFWGYHVRDNLTFQQCPKGYCCSASEDCQGYNTCASHRTGRLCGQCVSGYSEALFSPQCVPDETCGPFWLWPFAFGTGILYVLFLLFQKDIRGFIFSSSHNAIIRATFCRCCVAKAVVIAARVDCNGDSGKSSHDALRSSTPSTQGDNIKDTDHNDANDGADENDDENDEDDCPGSTAIPILEQHNSGKSANHARPSKYMETGFKPDEFPLAVNIHPDSKDHDHGEDIPTETETETETEPPTVPTAPQTDIGAILLIIVLYYFQDAMLFNIKMASDEAESKLWANIRTVMLGLFKFQLEVAHFVDNVCLLPGLSASQKVLALTILVPYVLILFIFLYVMSVCVRYARRTVAMGSSSTLPHGSAFTLRLSTGFMLALLFTYQRLAKTAFSLLNCVPIGEHSVLFLDGTVTCYQPWQFGVLAYALCCIIPFSIVLMLGPGLIRQGALPVTMFFLSCLCPLPFIIWWVSKRMIPNCKSRRAGGTDPAHANDGDDVNGRVRTAAEGAVLKVLQGPYRSIRSRYLGHVCWAGVLIFRRLLLILIFTFINHSLIRVLAMLSVCFLILLHHVCVRPYADPRVNMAGSVSISALIVVGGINLIRAGFEVAEYMPQGPNETLIYVMKVAEDVLMLWLPLVVISAIVVVVSLKITAILVQKCMAR